MTDANATLLDACKTRGWPYWATDDGRVTLINADCLDVLPLIEAGSVDAVVTDPPYSSGGQFRGDRARGVVEKYVQSGVIAERSDFSGDNLDQRVWQQWAAWMLSDCRRACKAGAVLECFIDWRQLPALTDAAQLAGWVWRNVCTWWKPGIRMVKGRFSNSSEFVVYATNGPHDQDAEDTQQNVFQCAPECGDDKVHIAEKPETVLEWLVRGTVRRGLIADPFMGSGTTGVAAVRLGRRFIGIEIESKYFRIAVNRIKAELRKTVLFEPPPKFVQSTLFE